MKSKAKLDAGGYREREPRIAMNCAAVLIESDGCELDVIVTDVSRDGFRLESHSELEVGAEVLLRVARLAPVKAIIRWACGREAGGTFLEPVAL